jgi:hypothetical protein
MVKYDARDAFDPLASVRAVAVVSIAGRVRDECRGHEGIGVYLL